METWPVSTAGTADFRPCEEIFDKFAKSPVCREILGKNVQRTFIGRVFAA